MPAPDGLAEFLRARLDAKELTARRTMQASPSWQNLDMDGELRDSVNAGSVAWIAHPEDRDHIALHDPANTLLRIAAERAVVDEHDALSGNWNGVASDLCPTCAEDTLDPARPLERASAPCRTLRIMATEYAGHPDYQEEWEL